MSHKKNDNKWGRVKLSNEGVNEIVTRGRVVPHVLLRPQQLTQNRITSAGPSPHKESRTLRVGVGPRVDVGPTHARAHDGEHIVV